MGKYASNTHVLGTCIKYCTNASSLGVDGTYGWRPNITGEDGSSGPAGFRSTYAVGSTTGIGAIGSSSLGAGGEAGGSTAQSVRKIIFNASNSNSIYTDNGKVYPASVAVNYIIKC